MNSNIFSEILKENNQVQKGKEPLQKNFLNHLKIKSLRNKLESVNELIEDTFNILLVSKSKLDSIFPESQFSMPGYRIIKKDRN